MASTLQVNKIQGSTGSTVTVPTGQSLVITDGLGVASGGTALTSFTAGDVLYATGSTTLAKLTKGAAEKVLSMNSGATAPEWADVDLTVLPTIDVATGGTALTSFSEGDILYATGSTTLAKLTKGAATEVFAMNSGATAPEWATAGGGKTLQIVRKDATGKTSDATNFSSAEGGTIGNIGTAHISQSFTPTSATSIIYVDAGAAAGQSNNGLGGAAIFGGTTCRAWQNANGTNVDGSGFTIHASWVSGSTAAVTIEFRTIGSYIGYDTSLGNMNSTGDATAPYGTMTMREIEPQEIDHNGYKN